MKGLDTLDTFLHRHKFHLIIRVFSVDPAGIKQQCRATRELVDRALGLSFNGRFAISGVSITVPSSPIFTNYDCGDTVAALLKEFEGMHRNERPVHVKQYMTGDQFVDIFNEEINHLARKNVSYMLTFSPSVRNYHNDTEMAKIITACHAGATMGGLILPQVEGVACGFLGNMAGFYKVEELIGLGGFDISARDIPKGAVTFTAVRHPDGKELAIPRKGVEETPVIAKAILRRKAAQSKLPMQFIAPILPETWENWQLPDKIEGYVEYHQLKVRSKWIRQSSYLHDLGVSFDDVMRAVMPGYRLEDYQADDRHEHLVRAIQATGYPLVV